MLRFALVLGLSFALSGCKVFQKDIKVTLSEHDHTVLKPALVNSFLRYGVLKGGCEESRDGYACSFAPGRYVKNVSYEYRLLKDGSWRIVILDSKELPLATMLIGDFEEEDLEDKKFITEDGQLTVELGHMLNARQCDPWKQCGKAKCCTPCSENFLESIVVITIKPETCDKPAPKCKCPHKHNPCKPCPHDDEDEENEPKPKN